MKKIKITFFISFAIFAIVTACRKDPKPSKQNTSGAYNPTYIDLAKYFPARLGIPNIPSDNPLTVEGMYWRMLFYDPVLSFDSSISCATCHQQKHAFADPNGGKVSTGIFGLKTGRNAPGIFNAAYSRTFFWDARQHTLREQLFEPIQAHNEMAMTLPLLEKKLARIERYKTAFKNAFNAAPDVFYMSLAIEQFEMGIVSSNSKYNDFFDKKNFAVLNADEKEGVLLIGTFFTDTSIYPRTGADCSHCHGEHFTQNNDPNNGGIANNGLDATTTDKGFGGITGFKYDMGTFKTMPLLNIAVTGPYMHDGRYQTIDQVINFYSDSVHFNSPNLHTFFKMHAPAHLRLTTQQKNSIKAILTAMTDNVLLNNPEYSNPFK